MAEPPNQEQASTEPPAQRAEEPASESPSSEMADGQPAGEKQGNDGGKPRGRGRENGARGRRRGKRGKGDRPDGDARPEGGRNRGESRKAEGKKGDGRERKGRGGGGRRGDRDRGGARSDSPLTAGLFASVKDREVECRVDGCKNTWLWFGSQQIRSMGKPPPARMCDEHLAQFNDLGDKQMPCRNSWCGNTWLWKRGAQLHQMQRQGKLKPPYRQCDQCFEEEKALADQQVICKMTGCERTWTWTRDAQVRHRAWARRQQAKEETQASAENGEEPTTEAVEATPAVPAGQEASTSATEAIPDAGTGAAVVAATSPEGDREAQDPVAAQGSSADEPGTQPSEEAQPKSGKKRKRKRRRKKKVSDGPPEKMCSACAAKFSTLEPVEQPCKVHGCTRNWVFDRGSQMRAWLAAGGGDQPISSPSRRMCESCRDFVRAHPDREVACGRPECEKTWTYKTGAQLQAFLAGRQDPIRLCDECIRSQFVAPAGRGLPPGAENMPCIVTGCEGTWVYVPGMALSVANEGDQPPDRMCDSCRGERGFAPRSPATAEADVDTSQPEDSNQATEENAASLAASPLPNEAASESANIDETPVEAPDTGDSAPKPTDESGPEAREQPTVDASPDEDSTPDESDRSPE